MTSPELITRAELESLLRKRHEWLSEVGKDARVIDAPEEIAVNHRSIKALRIGFTDPAFNPVLGSHEQYDRVAWGAYGLLNPDLAEAVMAEPRDGPYPGGYQMLVATFLKDTMVEVYDQLLSFSTGQFKGEDVVVQQGSYQGFPLIIATIVKCETEKPELAIEAKKGTLVVVPRSKSQEDTHTPKRSMSHRLEGKMQEAALPKAAPAASRAAPPIAPGRKTEVKTKTNVLAITSLVLGIVAIPLSCCLSGLGSLFGIASLITGLIGYRQAKQSDGAQSGEGIAVAGIILGGVSVLLGIASLLFLLLTAALGQGN
jgi:hypothetical protein